MFTPYQRRVVVAERDRAELRRINPALDWEVIPNGVDLEYFWPQPGQREAATLLFTGNFAYEPNEEAARYLARELLPRLREQLPTARLWLVGNAPSAAMRAMAGEQIVVSGRVPDLRPWLARASVFVCPLRLGAGIRNKALEALAAGCPLVATPLSVDGIAAVDGHHALLRERSGLPAAVQTLLGDARCGSVWRVRGDSWWKNVTAGRRWPLATRACMKRSAPGEVAGDLGAARFPATESAAGLGADGRAGGVARRRQCGRGLAPGGPLRAAGLFAADALRGADGAARGNQLA